MTKKELVGLVVVILMGVAGLAGTAYWTVSGQVGDLRERVSKIEGRLEGVKVDLNVSVAKAKALEEQLVVASEEVGSLRGSLEKSQVQVAALRGNAERMTASLAAAHEESSRTARTTAELEKKLNLSDARVRELSERARLAEEAAKWLAAFGTPHRLGDKDRKVYERWVKDLEKHGIKVPKAAEIVPSEEHFGFFTKEYEKWLRERSKMPNKGFPGGTPGGGLPGGGGGGFGGGR